MSEQVRDLARVRAVAAALVALCTFAFVLSLGTGAADARKKAKPAKVSLKVTTKNQAALLSTGKLTVKVTSTGKAKVRLSAKKGKRGGLVKAKAVRFKKNRKQAKRVKLTLTRRGRSTLGACGAQKVRVLGKYTKKVKKKGKLRKRKATARRAKKLASAPSRCNPSPNPNPNPNPNPSGPSPATLSGCDPQSDVAESYGRGACMLPFPNDYYARADMSTDTGIRLDFKPENMPKSDAGLSIFDDVYNRNDGFSPNNIIMTKVPGLETPAAFRANDIVSQLDIGSYDDPEQKVVLIDAQTKERVPIWAEIDMVPGTPNPHAGGDVQGTEADRMLLIHPAVSLDYGRRYVVAIRDLVGLTGTRLEPTEVFRYYRDGVRTSNQQVEDWRSHMDQKVFAPLTDAGIARGGLYAAWDFTVASKRNLTERATGMRDDAFAKLGDTNLEDGQVQGTAPQINDLQETLYDPCPANAPCDLVGEDGPQESRYAFKKVTGTISVPCYMTAPGPEYNLAQPDLPCASGSRLNYVSATDNVPQQLEDGNGDPVFWESPFTCIVPRTGPNEPTMATDSKAIVFGHGLLQNNETTERLGLYPAALEGVACGTDWIGLSATDLAGGVLEEGDLIGHLATMIVLRKNLALFSALPDRTQQGYINTLYLARAMTNPDGFQAESQFADTLDVDPGAPEDDLGYYGVSLGGINGGATTSLAPDWERATLGVPGMGFTTLLLRSTQFNQFLPMIYSAYTDPLSRQLGVSMLQILWDRGEPSAYSRALTDGSLGTIPHRIQIQESFGDHQVTNIQTESLARTAGAVLRIPDEGESPIAPGRIEDLWYPGGETEYLFTPMDEVEPYWGLPTATSEEFNQPGGLPGDPDAVFWVVDTGPITTPAFGGTTANPDWNIAPVGGSPDDVKNGTDPHQLGATSPASQQFLGPFLFGGEIYDPCGDGGPPVFDVTLPPYDVPYSSADPIPCPAPPWDYVGNGN